MKKLVAFIAIVTIAALIAAQPVEETVSSPSTPVRIAALKGPTAMGLVYLMEGHDNYSFTLEGSPDAIVPLIAKGEIDIACIPANLACVVSNNTGKVQVVAVNTLGVLYLVGKGEAITDASALRGKTIYSAGKGSTPQYALEGLLKSLGLEEGKDVIIEWRSEHAECVAALAQDSGALAMLPQPFATSSMIQNSELRIVMDLNDEWEKANGTPLITGCAVVRKDFALENRAVVDAFLSDYKESVSAVNSDTAAASVLIENAGIIKAAVAAKALPYCNIVCITGDEMKEALSPYIESLFAANPKSIGGQIPGEDFWY